MIAVVWITKRALCATTARHNPVAAIVAAVHKQRVCGFIMKWLADGRTLLFARVLLAGLLSFEDGVLALHFRPGQCAAGQIPNDHGQLADL